MSHSSSIPCYSLIYRVESICYLPARSFIIRKYASSSPYSSTGYPLGVWLYQDCCVDGMAAFLEEY